VAYAEQLVAAPGPAHEQDGGRRDTDGGGKEGGHRSIGEAIGGGRRHAYAQYLALPARDLVSRGSGLDPHGEEGPGH
jgi:hypothetical protein